MRIPAILATLLGLTALIAGCQRSADPNAVKIGMSAEAVRAALGAPVVLGGANSNINGQVTIRENWTYPMGDSGLIIVVENGRVLSKRTRPNITRAMLHKIREGMSKQAVVAAIGDTTQKLPGFHSNAADTTPTEKWMYTDSEAPIEILMIDFRGNSVSKAECVPNGIYTGQTGPGMPGPMGPH